MEKTSLRTSLNALLGDFEPETLPDTATGSSSSIGYHDEEEATVLDELRINQQIMLEKLDVIERAVEMGKRHIAGERLILSTCAH